MGFIFYECFAFSWCTGLSALSLYTFTLIVCYCYRSSTGQVGQVIQFMTAISDYDGLTVSRTWPGWLSMITQLLQCDQDGLVVKAEYDHTVTEV
jgi:hypothetical protein